MLKQVENTIKLDIVVYQLGQIIDIEEVIVTW